MHPDDAAARGLTEGDAIRMFNALGEVRCNVTVGAWIRPGTVSLPKGLWRRHTANGYTANALVPDTLTDLGGGACFNDARVQVENGVKHARSYSAPVLRRARAGRQRLASRCTARYGGPGDISITEEEDQIEAAALDATKHRALGHVRILGYEP